MTLMMILVAVAALRVWMLRIRQVRDRIYDSITMVLRIYTNTLVSSPTIPYLHILALQKPYKSRCNHDDKSHQQ